MQKLTAADMGIRTKAQIVKAIRVEWTEETGEATSALTAELLLERMCMAFVEAWWGYDVKADAVRSEPYAAEYLAYKWTGEDRKALHTAIAEARGLLIPA